MPLPTTGEMKFSQINTELGLSSTAPISLGSTVVRTLFGVSSGAISQSNGRGKSNVFRATVSSSQLNFNLRTWALANGWNGTTIAEITIAPGVYIWSNNTSIAGLTIDGSWPNGITLINNGFIMGMGGNGANGAGPATGSTAGGTAISLGVNATIINNSYIGGGGGGGGNSSGPGGGGGAGGGAGGRGLIYASPSSLPGGAGGTIGNVGGNGSGEGSFSNGGRGGGAGGGSGSSYFNYYFLAGGGGGGGGRIFPGVGGAGGAKTNYGVPGYAGGSAGNPGTTAPRNAYFLAGGGGGWGASGGAGTDGSVNNVGGSPGGRAIALNGFSAIRSGSGITYGAIS